MPVRVLLVDDHDEIRLMLRAALWPKEDFEVVGEALGGHEAVALAGAVQPDVVVLDNQMPGMSGLAALPLIRQAAPDANVIFYTAFEDDSYRNAAIESGAAMFLGKSTRVTEVVDAVRRLGPSLAFA